MSNILTILAIAVIIAFIVIAIMSSSKSPIENNQKQKKASESEVLELLQQGQKIAAIKMYRELNDVGLKEAKEAVEKMWPE